jgi:MFS superfamily sulfate permease-like transporter
MMIPPQGYNTARSHQAAFIGAAVIAAAGALLAAVLLRIPKAASSAVEPAEEQERLAA